MSEWQPIETAPKDGQTFILVFGLGFFRPIIARCEIYNGESHWFGDDDYPYNGEFTHWMPLPSPP